MLKKISISVLFSVIVALANAQQSEIFIKNNKAIDGYDAVAFFTKNAAIKGVDSLQFSWKNAVWIFSNQQNLDSFKANPQKYEPQYGGYCAYGCSKGYKAPMEIKTWSIIDEKLYFNYNLKVKEMWESDLKNLIEKANKNWLEIKDKK